MYGTLINTSMSLRNTKPDWGCEGIHTHIQTLLAFPIGLFNTKQHEHIMKIGG